MQYVMIKIVSKTCFKAFALSVFLEPHSCLGDKNHLELERISPQNGYVYGSKSFALSAPKCLI